MFIHLDDQHKSLQLSATIEPIQRKKHRQMDRLRRTLSFRSRKKSNHQSNINNNNQETTLPSPTTTTSSNKNTNNNGTSADNKPIQWQGDEKSVRMGFCSFNVKVNKHINFANLINRFDCLLFFSVSRQR